MSGFCYQEAPQRAFSCPLCGAAGGEELGRTDRYAMGVRTVMCTGCGLIRSDPTLTDQAWHDFYAHRYRTIYSKTAIPDADYLRRTGITARAAYTAARLIDAGLVNANAAVLDVGCSEGSILRALGERITGIVAVGVEPGERFAEFARSYAHCEVVADLDAARSLGRRFDLVIISHVLEHVTDPVGFLSKLRLLCQDSGRIYVDVPDAEHYGSLADLHIAHVLHFTRNTLALTATRAQLRVDRIESHCPPDHPPSLSMSCIPDRSIETAITPLGDAEQRAAQRIRQIVARSWWYHLKNTLPFRLLRFPFRRLMNALRSRPPH